MECGPDGCPIVAFSDLTPAEQRVERKRMAKKMSDQGFTQEQIAKQLGVSQYTICKDLEGNLLGTNKSKPAKTARNPKGAGRPKGSGRRSSRGKETPKLDDAREIVRTKLDADEAISPHKLEKEHGISHVTFDMAIAAELARREAVAEKTALDQSHLSKTSQEKLDAAIRAHQRKLDAEFHQRVNARVKEFTDDTILPDWKKKIAEAQKLYEKRKALMTKDTFNTIRRALHPDSRMSISDQKLGEAFEAFMALEKYLLDEKDSPTEFGALPRSYADWQAAKQKVAAARRAKREASRTAIRPR
jgi:IS30 family transposase